MAQTPRLRSPAAVRGVEDVEPSTGLMSGSHSDGGLHSPGSKKEYRGSPDLFWHFLAGGYKLKNATQTITIKSKVGSTLMALSLCKVEVGYSTKKLPNQG